MKLHYLAGAVALVLGTATVASAQGTPQGGPPPGRHGMGMGAGRRGMDAKLLFKGITLSKAQSDSISKLNAAQEAQMKALFDSFNGQRPDASGREKMRALRQQQAAEFRAVLTDDQKPIYDKNVADLKAAMQQHMRNRNSDRPGSPPPPPPGQ